MRFRWLTYFFVPLFGLTQAAGADGEVTLTVGGRSVLVHVPARLPPPGHRALVLVLHGGLGNANAILAGRGETALNLDPVADQDRFVVAYLNGTPVTRFMGPRFLGWNAGGGCCGVPAAKQVDDVGYIVGAAQFLTSTYGIDKSRIYAIGHSNGAMMAQRVMCETGLLAAEVAISGPLTADEPSCALARGKPILAIHGTDDNNVPLAGGVGRNGLSRVAYKSEADARAIFTRSGARYTLQLVPGVGHKLADLNAAIEGSEHRSIGEKAAAFFGLSTEKAAR